MKISSFCDKSKLASDPSPEHRTIRAKAASVAVSRSLLVAGVRWVHSNVRSTAILCTVFLLIIFGTGSSVGQTAHFSGVQTEVGSGLGAPWGIAADRNGNLYIADNGKGVEEILAVKGKIPASPTIVPLASFYSTFAVAVDSNGNLYVADSYLCAIREILAVNGSIPPSPTVRTLYQSCQAGPVGEIEPFGVAVDAFGNVYFSDYNNNAVDEILAVNGSIPVSPTVKTLSTSFNAPKGLAMDNSGNLLVADQGDGAVKEIIAVNGSIPVSPSIVTLASGFACPSGVAVDRSGNAYVADYCSNSTKEIVAVNGSIPASPSIFEIGTVSSDYTGEAGVAVASGSIYVVHPGDEHVTEIEPLSADFGSVNLGSASNSIPMSFTFDSAGILSGTSVLTQGTTNLDFTDAGTGTCNAGTAYTTGQSCTVNVKFAPTSAGARYGATVLKDANGNTIATGYLQGVGLGPQASFLSATENLISGTALSNPHGIAADGNGNIYVSDNDEVLKETNSSGNFTQSTIKTGVGGANLLALDGAGNLYIAVLSGEVLKETPTSTGYSESIVDSGFGYAYGVAVDGAGNVYIADAQGGRILKETPSGGSYVRNTVASGLPSAEAVAVDGQGNLYVAYAGGIVKEALAQGVYSQSGNPFGRPYPNAVAVDAAGNVYFTDSSTYNVYKETPTSGGYTESAVVTDLHNILGPWGITLDGMGKLYIAYLGGHSIVTADFAKPPAVNFVSTSVGATSTDSPQTVTLTNAGNADLTLPIPASGNNPSISANFTLDENAPSACQVTGSGASTAGVLPAGSSCVLPISFAPNAAGNISGSLVLTDNNLNAAGPGYATQSIVLAGTAIRATPEVTWPAPAAIFYGTALSGTQLDATASVTGTFSYSPAAGSVLAAGTQTLSVTFTPTDTANYTTATSTVQLTVNKATPVITWPTPTAINYGTALSGTQLNATANVPGTFAYTPAAGTVLNAGTNTLSVTFTPTDTADYTTATASVSLLVNAVQPPPNTIALDGANHCSAGAINVSSVSCTLPNVTAGDLITVEFSDRNGYMTSISDGANGTYGKIYYVADSGDPNYSGMAYFANSKAGSLTVKLALSRSDHWAKISVQAWKGAAISGVLDQSAITQHLTSTTGTVANATCGAPQNPSGAGELILAYLVNDNIPTVTAGANYTLIDGDSNNGNPSYPEYWIQTTGTATNGPFISAADDFTEGCAAFKPATATRTPITLEGTNHCSAGAINATSVSCTLPNVSAGDLITVEFSDRDGKMSSISDGANGTYNKIYYVPDTGDPNSSGMAYFANSTAGSLTVKLALSSKDFWAKISVQAWKGAATVAPLDQGAITQHLTSTSGAVANATCGSAQTPGAAGELILAYLVGDNDATVTAGTNYTLIDGDGNNGNPSYPEYWIQTTASPTNGSFISAPDDFTDGCAAFKPA